MNTAPKRTQLAIETTGTRGSIALFEDQRLVDGRCLDPSERTAKTLVPAIDQLVGDRVVSFVSVAMGPGSFTGLRIATTAAKSLGYAWQIPLVAVDSLAAIAAETLRLAVDDRGLTPERVIVAIDAYRGQAYVADFVANELTQASEQGHWGHRTKVVTVDQFSKRLETLGGSNHLVLAGDAKLFGSVDAETSAMFFDRCDAIGVGRLGNLAASRDQFVDPLSLVPRYFKPSAAEEKQRC